MKSVMILFGNVRLKRGEIMAYLGEYIEVGWENEPSQRTPVNAYNLGIMEDGIKRLFAYLIAGGGTGSGKDGREVELRNSGEYIQWRYSGEENWTNLVSLADLKGEKGDDYVLTDEDIEEIASKVKVATSSDKITYDDTETKLGATNVQDAIGKVSEQKVDKQDGYSMVSDSEKQAWNNKSDFSGSYNDLTDKPTIPTKTSEITNDSDFQTGEQVRAEIGKMTHFNFEIADSLEDVVKENVIYLIPNEENKEDNIFDEYLLVAGTPELIGSTAIDLSNFAEKEHTHSYNELKDKPFYEEPLVETPVIENATGSWTKGQRPGIDFIGPITINNGSTYKAICTSTILGTTLTETTEVVASDNGLITVPCQGYDLEITFDSAVVVGYDFAGELDISIYEIQGGLVQLDEKFIPDTIARKEDIPNAVTDEHINELINVALGVVENGSY